MPQIYQPSNTSSNRPGTRQRLTNVRFIHKADAALANMVPIRASFPEGTKIARWYCADGHMSFSLLPDFLASRLSGTLLEIEDVVAKVENSPSQEAAADVIRIDIELPGALRWMRRRIFLVKVALRILIELLPGLFADYLPSLLSFRSVLGVDYVLPQLRILAEGNLYILPPPIGFGPRPAAKKFKKKSFPTPNGH